MKLFLEAQQQSNETVIKLTNEIKLLKENYKKLELKISVSVNWTNTQYSKLEREKLLRYPLKFSIGFRMIKKTTVKFSKPKLCQEILRVKKELKNSDPSEFDLLKAQLF